MTTRLPHHPPVLMYHGFGHRDPHEDPNDLFLPADNLERQLRILRRWFRPLDLDGFLEAHRTGRWPRRSVLVTIDDGYVSTLEVAAPLLARHGVPSVVFVCPERLGTTSAWIPELPTERLMDAAQLRELAAARMAVGAHGLDHTALPGLPAAELEAHAAGSREALAAVLGQAPRAFAYPYGDVDDAAIEAVRAAGYDLAFAVGEHETSRDDRRFAVPRVNVNSYDSTVLFALKASGRWNSVVSITRGAPRLRRAAARLAGRRPYPARAGSTAGPEPQRGTHVQVVRGDVLQSFGAELDELLDSVSAPVTWRRPWLRAWLDCYRDYEPWGVVATQGDKPVGVGLFASRRRSGYTEVVAVGHGPSDQIRLPLRDPAAAEAMAAAIRRHVRTLPGPRRLLIDQLPADDPVARALAAAPACTLRAGDASPTVRFGSERSVRAYTSRNHHQLVRRLTNRLRRDGLPPEYALVTDVADIEALLPEIERVCLRRDAQLGRRSQLQEPDAGPFFRRVIGDHSARGEVAVTTLRLGGRLASYALCFVDRSAHRMWNSRFEPEFAQYGPGRLVLDAALRHALADPRIDELDWMRGEEGYKFSSATEVVPAHRVLAWSPGAVLGAELAARSALPRLRAARSAVTARTSGGRR